MDRQVPGSGLDDSLPDTPMGREIAAFDWEAAGLGPVGGWPCSLRTLVAMMLACPTPMFLAWGPRLLCLFNDAYRPILGWRADHALGLPFREVWESIWPDISPLVEGAMAGRPQKVVDMRLDISRDGVPEESYWTFTYSPAYGDDGRIAGMFCVTGETTSSVMAERARQRADERLELALSSGNSIGIWDWDVPEGRITADSRFASLYGVDPALAATGAPKSAFFARIHPDDLARVEEEARRAIEDLTPFTSEYRLLGPDGSVRWVSAQGRCVAGPDGRCHRFPGVSYDITDLKEAELRLRGAMEEREFVLDQIARHRLLTDPEEILRISSEAIGKRLGVNRVGFYRVLGARTVRHEGSWTDGVLAPLTGGQGTGHYGPFAEAERRRGQTMVFGDSRSDAGEQLQPYAAEGVLAGICVPLMTDGAWAAGIYLHQASVRCWKPAEIALAKEVVLQTWLAIERAEALISLNRRIADQEAEIAQREAVLREEFARREAAETQLRQLQKMEAVGQLTGGIAHDFNNMLAVVISGLNMAQRRLAKGEAGAGEFIDGALEGAKRAAALTHRLLAFARQQPLQPGVVDANALVGGLADMLSRSLGERVRLERVLAPDLRRARVDPNQLENALVNLAVNARDAMPEGGSVTIETANAMIGAAEARETGIDAGRYVLITVSDTGTGMTPEVLAKAFDPFFTTKAVGKGTGLGLSQVYGFIRQSGGHIRIASQPGEGTRAELYLPVHEGAGTPAPAPRRADGAAQEGSADEAILVVEDEERVRNFTAEALRELGYTVLPAASGAEALDILAGGAPVSLIFTDIVMPQMTGPQLSERARALRPDLRVVFTSGFSGNARVTGGGTYGGHGFLSKPFSFDQLAAAIRAALDEG